MYVTVPGGSGFDPLGDGVTIAVKEFVQPYAYVYVMFSPPRSVGLANLRGRIGNRRSGLLKSMCGGPRPHRSQVEAAARGGCARAGSAGTHMLLISPSCMQSSVLSICGRRPMGAV